MKTKSDWLLPFLTMGLALALTISPVIADANGFGAPARRPGRGKITVMTMNVYVGADVDRILQATDFAQIPLLVKQTFDELFLTDFRERAEAIAKQIARLRPHLIGLQEISLIRIQKRGDAASGGAIPATEVVFDYLEILQAALTDYQLHYEVAGKVQNADIEVPMLVREPSDNPFDDVRLTDYDVVLARSDVKISNTVKKNYDVNLTIPELGITIPRGYVAVDATIKKRTYRFVNTHLEPLITGVLEETLQVQRAQAAELISTLEGEDKPVIVVGDLNTPAPTGDTYQLFESNGFIDVWDRNLKVNEAEGFTFPHDPLLMNQEINLDRRIDLIFVRNAPLGKSLLGPVIATVWGDALRDRTPSGLWPSDHAAVIARMWISVFGRVAYAQ